MSKALVFHNGQLYKECAGETEVELLAIASDKELYNNAWVFYENRWWRLDQTPYPTAQVPKEVRALALLLT